MIRRSPRTSGIPGLTPPEILVFLRIPKTAGTTMEAVFERSLPGANFHGHIPLPASALWVRPTSLIAEKFHRLSPQQQRAVRCLVDTHVAMDVETVFDRPVRFFTIVRDPVDRAISNFFHTQVSDHLPCYPFVRNMSIEEYLDSGIGIDADNHQVRILSGCASLDCSWDPQGRPLSTPPVERRHLELAKRNIEERFIVAAPIEQVIALIWFFKRLYDWPLHLAFFNVHNEAADNGRPTVDVVPHETRNRLRELNQYDTELYGWVKQRFADQIAPLEPAFSREVRRFEQLNGYMRRIDRSVPSFLNKAAKGLLSSVRRDFSSRSSAAAK
jgi:Sulfotransferase family